MVSHPCWSTRKALRLPQAQMVIMEMTTCFWTENCSPEIPCAVLTSCHAHKLHTQTTPVANITSAMLQSLTLRRRNMP
jgi:hypothetical protein